MSASIDRNGVIVSLTDGVGAHFGRASRRSFYFQLERLERHPLFERSSPEEQQCLVDLLAMASFYQCVVIPIHSSARFVSVLRAAGATHLRVAGDQLGPQHARRAGAVTASFRATLHQAKIPENLLSYATLKEFIASAHEFYQSEP